MFVEAIEPRRMMAGTALDAAFAGGAVKLPASTSGATAVLAVNGSVYVAASTEIVDGDYSTYGVYKYDDRGRLDTSWGSSGFAPLSPGLNTTIQNVTQFAYDKRTGALWAAGDFAQGGTDGGARVSEIQVARFDAEGNQTAVYQNGVPQYRTLSTGEEPTRLTLGRIVPLPHGKAVLSFDRDVQTGYDVRDGVYDEKRTHEVMLMVLGRNGTRDASFGKRGLTTVLEGVSDDLYGTRTTIKKNDTPTTTDLQLRSDGAFRVIDTRRRGTETLLYDGHGRQLDDTLDSTTLVDSIVVRADGTLMDKDRHVWRASRVSASSGDRNPVADFTPLLAVAEGSDGVLLAGGRKPTGTVYFHLTPGTRPPATTLPTPAGTFAITRIIRDDRGVLVAIGASAAVEYSPRLRINDGFGEDGVAVVDDIVSTLDQQPIATDERGRLLVAALPATGERPTVLRRFV